MFERNEMVELLYQEKTLAETISQRAEKRGGQTAIIFNDEKITFKQLNDKIDSLATAFLKMGISAKDRIAVILPTRPEFLYVWYAASKIGAAVVGLNFRYREEEIIYMVNNSKPSVLVCINEFAGTNYNNFLTPILSKLPTIKHFIFLGPTSFPNALNLENLLNEKADPPLVSKSMAALKPKG